MTEVQAPMLYAPGTIIRDSEVQLMLESQFRAHKCERGQPLCALSLRMILRHTAPHLIEPWPSPQRHGSMHNTGGSSQRGLGPLVDFKQIDTSASVHGARHWLPIPPQS